MTEIELRPARPDDLAWVKWALYTAVAWDPGRSLPPPEVTVEHPELARYHRGGVGYRQLSADDDGVRMVLDL